MISVVIAAAVIHFATIGVGVWLIEHGYTLDCRRNGWRVFIAIEAAYVLSALAFLFTTWH